MGKVGLTTTDPKNPQQIADALTRLIEEFDGRISFGNPQDPTDDASTDLAGSTDVLHPGTLINMEGAWVELDVDTLDSNVTCYHHLNQPVSVSGEPNVRWLEFGYLHSGVGTAEAIGCWYEDGTVTANSIQLRFGSSGRTVAAGANVLKATLFFIPAIRRP